MSIVIIKFIMPVSSSCLIYRIDVLQTLVTTYAFVSIRINHFVENSYNIWNQPSFVFPDLSVHELVTLFFLVVRLFSPSHSRHIDSFQLFCVVRRSRFVIIWISCFFWSIYNTTTYRFASSIFLCLYGYFVRWDLIWRFLLRQLFASFSSLGHISLSLIKITVIIVSILSVTNSIKKERHKLLSPSFLSYYSLV